MGGGIKKYDDAKYYFENGADKIIINSKVLEKPELIKKISHIYGSSSVIISIDVKLNFKNYFVYTNNGQKNTNLTLENYLEMISKLDFAEIYLNSIDRDGTGTGLDKKLLSRVNKFNFKYIISGGLGNYKHFLDGFKFKKVEAIATSNLLNFLGDVLNCKKKITTKIDLVK